VGFIGHSGTECGIPRDQRKKGNKTNKAASAKPAKKKTSYWRRIPREEKGDDDGDLGPKTKKINNLMPSLEVCLGKENLERRREEEFRIIKANKNAQATGDADSSSTAGI
jgi:hypothetical protein